MRNLLKVVLVWSWYRFFLILSLFPGNNLLVKVGKMGQCFKGDRLLTEFSAE